MTRDVLIMKNGHLAILLCLMVAFESTAIKWVSSVQHNSPPAEQLVVIIEAFKLLVCGFIYLVQRHYEPEVEVRSSVWWFMIPASLYAVSNNITFKALESLSAPMFNLLMNLKIPFTGLLAAGFLSYRITPLLATSFIMLFVGSAIACVTWDNGVVLDVSAIGIMLMIVYSLCSASAAVYTEYVTKVRFGEENLFLQNVKFCICGLVVNSLVILFKWDRPFKLVEPVHMISVLGLSLNGLVTAAVLKYGGSILKTYSVSVAMFVAAFFSYIIWRTVLHWNFWMGATVCAVAVNLYARAKTVRSEEQRRLLTE